jgi:hypothetical protein
MNVVVGTTIILAATLIMYKLLTPVTKPTKKKEPVKKKESTKKVNPYFAFCKEKRPDIVAANPELKPREIVKKLGEEWGKLSDVEKDEYRIAFTFSKPK